MDTEKVLERMSAALELQLRSLVQFTQSSGSMFGLEVQGLSGKLWEFAHHEHEVTEAPEHLMEHIIMRKQNQIDWLRRARRQP
jgi:hypothetical protein